MIINGSCTEPCRERPEEYRIVLGACGADGRVGRKQEDEGGRATSTTSKMGRF